MLSYIQLDRLYVLILLPTGYVTYVQREYSDLCIITKQQTASVIHSTILITCLSFLLRAAASRIYSPL